MTAHDDPAVREAMRRRQARTFAPHRTAASRGKTMPPPRRWLKMALLPFWLTTGLVMFLDIGGIYLSIVANVVLGPPWLIFCTVKLMPYVPFGRTFHARLGVALGLFIVLVLLNAAVLFALILALQALCSLLISLIR